MAAKQSILTECGLGRNIECKDHSNAAISGVKNRQYNVNPMTTTTIPFMPTPEVQFVKRTVPFVPNSLMCPDIGKHTSTAVFCMPSSSL